MDLRQRWVAVAVLLSTSACFTDPSPPPGRDRALAVFHELSRTQPTQLRGERFDARGTFLFLRVQRQGALGVAEYGAVMASGDVLPLETAEAQFAAAHVAEWGSLDYDSARFAVSLSASEQVTGVALVSPGEADAFVREAGTLGVRVSPVGDLAGLEGSLEALLALARTQSVRRVVLDPREPAQAFGLANLGVFVSPSSAILSNNDVIFNDLGESAAGVKLGMTEINMGTGSLRCGLWNDHEAFQTAGSVTMQQAPMTCTVDGDCLNCNNPWAGAAYPPRCIGGRCVSAHATKVASVLLANHVCSPIPPLTNKTTCESALAFWDGVKCFTCKGGAFQAAKASLFVANRIDTTALGNDLVNAYDFFRIEEVRTVNESWGPVISRSVQEAAGGAWSMRSFLQDFFARVHGITFVVAAGQPPQQAQPNDYVVSCAGLGSLCVGGSAPSPQSRAAIRDFRNTPAWPFGFWRNAGRATGLEVEKPDLLAPASGISTANFRTTVNAADWTFDDGTSFAAPNVAATLGLVEARCGQHDPLWNRAVLRTSAWNENSVAGPECPSPNMLASGTAPNYPYVDRRVATTPSGVKTTCDYRGGTGLLNAANVALFCASPGPGTPCKDPTGEPCPTGWAVDRGTVGSGDAEWKNLPSIATNPSDFLGNAQRSSTYTTGLVRTGTHFRVVRSLGAIGAGRRIRASLAYHSCPAQPSAVIAMGSPFQGNNVNPMLLKASVNFDLGLCGQQVIGGPTSCVWLSESLDDTNEGFDVVVPVPYASLDLWLIGPRVWTPCDLTPKNQPPDGREPWVIAHAIW